LTKDLKKALTRSHRESTTSDNLPGAITSDDEGDSNNNNSSTGPGRGSISKAMSYRSSNLPSKQLSYRSAHLPSREMSMTSAFGAQGSGAGGMRGQDMDMQNFVEDAHGRKDSEKKGSKRHHSLTSSANVAGDSGGAMGELKNIVDLQVSDAALIAQQALEQKMEEITRAFIITRRQSGAGFGDGGENKSVEN